MMRQLKFLKIRLTGCLFFCFSDEVPLKVCIYKYLYITYPVGTVYIYIHLQNMNFILFNVKLNVLNAC